MVGAITGTMRRPQTLVLGRFDAEGALRPVGRSTPLRPDAARDLAGQLTPAGPGHPWGACGSRLPGARGRHSTSCWSNRSWSPRSWWTRRKSAGHGGIRCASPGSGWTSRSRTSRPSGRAPSPPVADRSFPAALDAVRAASRAGEDVVGADATPDDVCTPGCIAGPYCQVARPLPSQVNSKTPGTLRTPFTRRPARKRPRPVRKSSTKAATAWRKRRRWSGVRR